MPKTNGAIFDESGNLVVRVGVEKRSLNEITFHTTGRVAGELTVGKTANIKLYDMANGLVDYQGVISRVSGKEIEVTGFHRMRTGYDRRSDIKVTVNRPVYLLKNFEENGRPQTLKFLARLKDIGAGGVCVISAMELDPSASYELVFDLAREVDVLSLRILRHTQNEAGEHIYGCAFEDLTLARESRIREYVFRRQLGLIGKVRTEAAAEVAGIK